MKPQDRTSLPDEKLNPPVTSESRLIWLVAVILTSLACYAILVVGDYVVARRNSYLQEQIISASAAIERKRQVEEDFPQREAAIRDGYMGLIFPDVIERYKSFRAIATKYGIAPLAPHPNSLLYYCNEGYGLITYRSDRFGFRNPDEKWEEGAIDYVLMGDSYTQGACVADDQNLAGILGRNAKTLNLGVGGNSPIHYAATAKTFIPRIKPKIAIMVFNAGDNDDEGDGSLYYQFFFKREAAYFDVRSERLTLNEKIKNFYRETESIVRNYHGANGDSVDPLDFADRGSLLARLVRYFSLPNIRMKLGLLDTNSIRITTDLPFSSRLAIDTLAGTCERTGCRPVVTYMPHSEFWRPDPRSAQYLRHLREYAARSGITFIDNTSTVVAIGGRAYARKGSHFSPEGYELVGKNIENSLKQ